VLPFLKNKQKVAGVSGIIIKNRQPDDKPDTDEDDPSAAIKACAQSLIDAVHSKNVQGVSDALADAFAILDSMPHEEGEHVEPHSYDAQNEAAAEED